MNEITNVRPIEVITAEIQFYKAQAGTSLLEIGRRLIEAKEQLGHGDWLPWLHDKAEFSERTAQNLMRIAREYTNPPCHGARGASPHAPAAPLPRSTSSRSPTGLSLPGPYKTGSPL